eukprot:12923-Heterococcus_DN1.PRE.1
MELADPVAAVPLLLLLLVQLLVLVLLREWPHERAAVATNSCARAAQSGEVCVVSVRGHTEQE